MAQASQTPSPVRSTLPSYRLLRNVLDQAPGYPRDSVHPRDSVYPRDSGVPLVSGVPETKLIPSQRLQVPLNAEEYKNLKAEINAVSGNFVKATRHSNAQGTRMDVLCSILKSSYASNIKPTPCNLNALLACSCTVTLGRAQICMFLPRLNASNIR